MCRHSVPVMFWIACNVSGNPSISVFVTTAFSAVSGCLGRVTMLFTSLAIALLSLLFSKLVFVIHSTWAARPYAVSAAYFDSWRICKLSILPSRRYSTCKMRWPPSTAGRYAHRANCSLRSVNPVAIAPKSGCGTSISSAAAQYNPTRSRS